MVSGTLCDPSNVSCMADQIADGICMQFTSRIASSADSVEGVPISQ